MTALATKAEGTYNDLPTWIEEYIDRLYAKEEDVPKPDPNRNWPGEVPVPPTDPLVLDLDGDGVELIPLAASTTNFDFDGDGFKERTGWVKPDDGFLFIDANGNGKVDGLSELFGNQTIDGFTALAVHDANSDGVINSSDAKWWNLRVWRDLNSDGISTTNEVQTMAQEDVAYLQQSKKFQSVSIQSI
jgi:hypothetical protein